MARGNCAHAWHKSPYCDFQPQNIAALTRPLVYIRENSSFNSQSLPGAGQSQGSPLNT
jgi:hypothetical protein